MLYSGQSGVTLSGLTDIGNESVDGALSVTGASVLANESVNAVAGSGKAPALFGMSVNGRINVQAYGAKSGINVTTGTISASSNQLSVVSASGWSAGDPIIVPHAGAATSLATLGVPTVTPVRTASSTTYSYEIVALDAKHGYSAPSLAGTTTTGNATLSGTSFNRIAWSAVAGAWGYAVYQTAPRAYLVAITTGTHAVDTGNPVFSADGYLAKDFWDIPSTAPSSAAADWLQTTIRSISGTTFTLATSATTTASGVGLTHDDTAPITNAVATATGTVYFPAGSYFFCGTPLNPSTINLLGAQLGQATVYMCPGQYLFNSSAHTYGIRIRCLTFVGGTGTLDLTYSGSLTSGVYSNAISDNSFVDYSGAAIAWEPSVDSPFWKVDHNMFAGLDYKHTIGLLANPSTGNQILNNNFEQNRIGIKAPGSGTGLLISGNTFIRMQPQANPQTPRVGIWLVPASGTQEGAGFLAAGNKFGNENLANDDLQVLVADDDTSTGTSESTYMPLYDNADDLSISASGTTLTSAAECPFTSAMCQGGTGCTGSAGNWPIVIEGAGTGSWSGLTTMITGYTSACSVTVGNAASAAVSSAVGRFAPADTTNSANTLQFTGGFTLNLGYAGQAFMASTANAVTGIQFNGVYYSVNTILEYLPVLSGNTSYYGAGDLFVADSGFNWKTNQDALSAGQLTGQKLELGHGTKNTGLVTNTSVPILGAYYQGLAVEGNVPFSTGTGLGEDLFDVFPNDATTKLLRVTSLGDLLSYKNTLDDGKGNASFAGVLAENAIQTTFTGSSGTAKCVEPITGTALKTVSCFLNAYKETGTAQSFTFPTAFSTTPVLLESGGSCGIYSPSVTSTALTLPANLSMTAETCNVIAIGQ